MSARIKGMKEWREDANSPREIADAFDRRAMTVGDLKQELENFSDDTPVVAISNYGDIGNTQQVIFFRHADEYSVNDFHGTGYSDSGIAMNSQDRDGYGDEEEEDVAEGSVVVLL